jgi:phosphatidylglycerophosphatase A
MTRNEKIGCTLATWFGVGLFPIMSGTMGSLAALPFAWLIHVHFGRFALLAAAVVIFIIGCCASSVYLDVAGQEEDPSEIVIDEVAGMWLLLAFLFPTWESYLGGFVLFRLFDIIKPWPVSVADKNIKGGFGVMFDDTLAALYPVVVYIVLWMSTYVPGNEFFLKPIVDFLSGQHVQ